MYYLNSRYYDSKICRFINADTYVSTGQSLTGNNMFAYCDNNPVMRYDSAGEYSAEIMGDRNPLDDFIRDGASSGGYNGGVSSIGPGSAYYNYSVYSQTSSYNASLGGYHTSSVSSGVVNPYYYYVPGGVSVNDSMATDRVVTQIKPDADSFEINNFSGHSLSAEGSPNSISNLYFNGELKQQRIYGPNGRALADIDYFHGGTNHIFPHIHFFDWSKNPPRGGGIVLFK